MARYLLISFDSNTNTLNYSTDATGAITSQQPLSDSDLNDLKDAITREEFFNTETTFSPKENETYVASNLSITVDEKVHTTTWADTSEGVPEGLKKIRDEIKKLIADKKWIFFALRYKWRNKNKWGKKSLDDSSSSSSKELGEFEKDDSGYVYLYMNIPKIVEKIAITSDMLPPFSDHE